MNTLIKSLSLYAVLVLIAATIGCTVDGGEQGTPGVGEPPAATPTPTPISEPPPGGGVMPGGIPQKILNLRPLRGMGYVPSPSDFAPACAKTLDPPTGDPAFCRYFDADFTNDDFRALWSSDNPGGTGQGRADLESMAMNLNVNFVRLYDWGAPPLRNHINFLNEANSHGIKVAVPISNFTLQCIRGDQACRDCCGDPLTFAKNNTKNILAELITNGKPHEAIAMWTIGNEFELNGFHPDVVATAIQFLIEAEEELGVTDEANKLPITVPISFAASFCCSDESGSSCRLPLAGCDPIKKNCGEVSEAPFLTCVTFDPGELQLNELMNAISNNQKASQILNSRFFASLQTFNDDVFLKTFLEETFPQKFPDLALVITELGIDTAGSGGTEQTQAAFVKKQLDLCKSLIAEPPPTTNPNGYFLGCTYFEWLNSVYKGGTEATFGANKFGGMLGTGKTVGVPTSGPENYPIDELVEKPVFSSIMEAFMN
jgi:hypothetical protein